MKVNMNARLVGIALVAMAALSVGMVACGGGKSSADKTKAATTGTPKAGSTASASASTNKTPGSNKTDGGTPGANQTAGTASAQTPGSTTTQVAGGSPIADVTIRADGTATNSQGTPVAAPTPGTADTPAPGSTAAPGSTVQANATPAPGSGPRMKVEAPATASGDFTVTVRLDGVAGPYKGFNVSLTFDEAIISAVDAAAGAALTGDPSQQFCATSPASVTGRKTLGCTLLNDVTSTASGVLVTFSFKRNGSGAAQIRMTTLADGTATNGTYLIVTESGESKPVEVALNNATVTVS